MIYIYIMPRGTRKRYFKRKNTPNKRRTKKRGNTRKRKQRRTRMRRKKQGGWKCDGYSNISKTGDCKPGKYSIITMDDNTYLVWGMSEEHVGKNNRRNHILYEIMGQELSPIGEKNELSTTPDSEYLISRELVRDSQPSKNWRYFKGYDIDTTGWGDPELVKDLNNLKPGAKQFYDAYLSVMDDRDKMIDAQAAAQVNPYRSDFVKGDMHAIWRKIVEKIKINRTKKLQILPPAIVEEGLV
jgi:hypothetical protein